MRGLSAPRLRAVPHSWIGVFVGLGLVTLGAVVSLFLMLRYLDRRPLDLFDQTAQLMIVLEDALLANGASASNLDVSEPVARQDDGASWYWFSVDAAVPSSADLDRLVAGVGDVMALNHVSLAAEAVEQPERRRILALSCADREFAYVRLVVIAPSAGPQTVHDGPSENESPRITPLAIDLSQVVAGAGLYELDSLVDLAWPGLHQSPAGSHPVYPTPFGNTSPAGTPLVQPPHVDAPLQTHHLDRLLELALPDIEELPLDSHGLDSTEMAPPPSKTKSTVATGSARLAIIVDDGGYGGSVTESILALDPSLTLAILPHTPHSVETARRAAEAGFEVLLHMPMENSADKKTFPGHVSTKMTPQEVHGLLEKALEDVPNATGINNHEGSKFTANALSMRSFLEVVKEKGLFFVDSRTISSSVASTLARDMAIRTGERDVFLDHDSDPAVIRQQLEKLVSLAKERGYAIGICHFRPKTAAVLGEFLAALKDKGVTLVHVSELVK